MRIVLVAFGLAIAAGTSIVACNAVLGIDEAALPGADAGDASAKGGAGDALAVTNSDPLDCANYCKVVAQNCTGEYLEYLPSTNPEEDGLTDPCLYLCNHYLSPGTYDPPDGAEPPAVDTLACRLWHAHAAASTGHPEIHCRHAGPLGSTLCGDPCASFCNLDYRYCVDDHNVETYPTQMACQDVCIDTVGSAPQDAGFVYNQSVGDITDDAGGGISSGNTLNCRLWHLETSIQEGLPSEHCWHTAFPSLNPPAAAGDMATVGGPCTN